MITPNSNRIHIGIFGRRNVGKSSLINALTGQKTALVSPVAGTTTDPVTKAMELYPIGACLLIDTAGFDDVGDLGAMRVEQTSRILGKTDMAVLVLEKEEVEKNIDDFYYEKQWIADFKSRKIPFIIVVNKVDNIDDKVDKTALLGALEVDAPFVFVSTQKNVGINELKNLICQHAPVDFELDTIAGHLVAAGDHVLLVAPQDLQAPKGRLILPQVQTIRDLLDNKAIVSMVTTEEFLPALELYKKPPKLIICDSQVFDFVYAHKPEGSDLTSFSVLMARYKGDIDEYVLGAKAFNKLCETANTSVVENVNTVKEKANIAKEKANNVKEKANIAKKNVNILIAEACSHNPQDGDIGRIKIPAMIRKKLGNAPIIDVVAGSDFPNDVSKYDLVIHCGGCMFNRKHVLTRITQCKTQNVPITNYGIFIANFLGILDKVVY